MKLRHQEESRGDWWRPTPGSKWEQRLGFIGTAIGIATGAFALAGITWTVASSDDGRIKALLWWAIGVTAAGAWVLFSLKRREHKDIRFGRALESIHAAHHNLRDAAYSRYIQRSDRSTWMVHVNEAVLAFANAFTVATGASCHATIKALVDESGTRGADGSSPETLRVETLARSAKRSHIMRAGAPVDTVGRNTDFRTLFSTEGDHRCWYRNDLLQLDGYENSHWPEHPKPSNVPYRSTMVWPIRKVLSPGSATTPRDSYILGFLTVDSAEPNIFVHERHFHIGAAFADHLLSVLWNPSKLGAVSEALGPQQEVVDGSSA